MKILSTTPLAIPDVKLISFGVFADERGYFTETLRVQDLTTIPKIPDLHGASFYQMNESYSHENVFRGLHFQWKPHMGKLVRAIEGSILDIALDIRQGSETFGFAVIQKLSYDKKSAQQDWIWVPPGFAHGFLSMSKETRIEYVCTGWWNPQCERGITIHDKDIDWTKADKENLSTLNARLPKLILNEKDKVGSLKDWKNGESIKEFTDTLPKH